MNERPSTQLTQLALAILLIVGVFAGGVSITFAADDDVPEVRTSTATEVDETAAVWDTAAESAGQTEIPEATEPAPLANLDKEADAAFIAESSCSYEPSPEDIADMAAENAELAALLDRYGIEYEAVDYPDGFSSIEYDFSDPVVESLVQSFYEDRYAPIEEELAEMHANNQALIDAFDAADIDYGFEELDIDFDEQRIDEDREPTEGELAEMNELNDALTAALDEAGIAYERIVEGAFEWIDWDYDDDAASEVADRLFTEGFPHDFAELPEGDFYCDEIVDQGFVDGDFVEGLDSPGDFDDEARNDTLRAFAADLEGAGVDVKIHEEDEEYDGWVWVTLGFENDAAIPVVQAAVSTTN